MKQFDIQAVESGEYIIHLAGNNSLYTVTYDHGQIIFENDNSKYIIPEGVGHYANFLYPDPNTGKEKYILNNVRDLYRDTTPTDFGLGANLVDVANGSSHFTEEIVIGGINESTPVIAPNGVKIYVNDVEVASGSTVENGDVVKFELVASSSPGTSLNFNLSVGDITKTFSIATKSELLTPVSGAGNYTFDVPLDSTNHGLTLTNSSGESGWIRMVHNMQNDTYSYGGLQINGTTLFHGSQAGYGNIYTNVTSGFTKEEFDARVRNWSVSGSGSNHGANWDAEIYIGAGETVAIYAHRGINYIYTNIDVWDLV